MYNTYYIYKFGYRHYVILLGIDRTFTNKITGYKIIIINYLSKHFQTAYALIALPCITVGIKQLLLPV